jgi:plastocyanin
MRAGVRIGANILVTAGLLASCTAAGTGSPPPSAPAGGAAITAANTSFDRTSLEVPAGQPFKLLFENREGAPHNVRIYGENVDQALFVGEVFGGPGSRTYEVPAIPPGTYRFRCDVHPDMAGSVIAR